MGKEERIDLWEIERSCWDGGLQLVCGVDEAGRGPLAGPVCAAAVILPHNFELPGLNDSKKLSDKKRRELFSLITSCAVSYGIAMIDEREIDQINILQSTFRAMEMAVERLDVHPDVILVDGNQLPPLSAPSRAIVKGDSLSASIAAASILAKVTRDRWMEEQDRLYPEYGFATHKGYGTQRHYAALRQYGPCPIHRKSFLKKFYGEA